MKLIDENTMKNVAVIGGGPAGLMAAEVLSGRDIDVQLYEAKSSIGRKFLVAGKGGLNLTHDEPFDQFVDRYRPNSATMRKWLENFGPDQIREWCHQLGIETFTGPSGRAFPKDLKAFPLLQKWTQRLQLAGVIFHTSHRWQGWTTDQELIFETSSGTQHIKTDAVILALGGASWSKLGSDGKWVSMLDAQGIEVSALRPANCGFEIEWSPHFREKFAGEPLKSIGLSFTNTNGEKFNSQGSCVVTEYGLESGVIYSASALLRDEITEHGSAVIEIDLLPDLSEEQVLKKLSVPRGSKSLSNHLRKQLKLQGVETGLLYEFAKEQMNSSEQLAHAIKGLKIRLTAARSIEEAISTAGGVRLESLDEHLMVQSHPGLFCAGEMLDWEAPTGGYLLTACFASGRVAASGVIEWFKQG
jgi:uncharacterized flavoprotein (TIGR03862 family)